MPQKISQLLPHYVISCEGKRCGLTIFSPLLTTRLLANYDKNCEFFYDTSIFLEKLYIPKFCLKYNTMLRFNAKHLKGLMQNI